MGIATHDGPIGGLDVLKEVHLFLGTGPGLRRFVGRARNKPISRGGNCQSEGRHDLEING